jgi:3-hydroxyacyl-CoA dehydrogenase / enoyl-CoA hydratase / 3-hydroxybutyryl-CoA epimerase
MTTEPTAITWNRDDDGIVTLTIDDPGHSVNTMNALYLESLRRSVGRLVAEKETIKGVIITSGKKTFFAGADLTVLIEAEPEHAKAIFDSVEETKRHLRALETLGKPVVAALNGTALGGGFEIALACHRRIAIDDPKSEFGLPEVTLGLLPGSGGITRTVRLLGIQKALVDVLLQGTRFRPAKAKEVGIIDELVADRASLLAKAREYILATPSAKQPWDENNYKMPGGTPSTPSFAATLPAFPANLAKQIKGANYPAPKAILAAAVEGAQVDFETASRIESRYIIELVTGKVAKNMMKAFFFDLQKINAGASRPKDVPAWTPQKVAVLGAGMMGQGIAYVTAMAGIPVVLKDVSLEAAERGKAYSKKLLDGAVAKGRTPREKADAILASITPTASAADLAGCDMIIEAVFENRELKAKVTAEAEANAASGALFGSNTSTLPITGLAKASRAPARFLGLHFFSPVDKMPLVEIIVGKETSPEALAQAFDYVLKIKKTPIVVNDSRGFFTSRVFATFVHEGFAMLGEGEDPQSIEQAALQAGMPVGPLAVADEVSLELMRHAREQTKADFAAEGKKYEAHAGEKVVDRMLAAGRKGKAAGAGFYEYPKDGKKHLWAELRQTFNTRKAPASASEFRELQDRLLYIQSIETVRCLTEGVLRSVPDANIGSIFGIGAPPWTGGVLQFVNYVGARAFVSRARALAAKHGPRFEPPPMLVDMAERNDTFR